MIRRKGAETSVWVGCRKRLREWDDGEGPGGGAWEVYSQAGRGASRGGVVVVRETVSTGAAETGKSSGTARPGSASGLCRWSARQGSFDRSKTQESARREGGGCGAEEVYTW